MNSSDQLNPSENGRKIWTRTNLVLYVLFSSFHLIISLLNFGNVVWAVNYESAKQIANGIPMYKQEGFVTRKGRTVWLPPDHFPGYFYFVAGIIKIFGDHEFIVRTITWMFVIVTFHLMKYLAKPKNPSELSILQVLYFVNPLLIIINYFGKFDQIAIFFLILGLVLILQKKYLFSGVILGLGTMVKFFPIFGFTAGVLFLFKKKEYGSVTKLISGMAVSAGSIFLYFYMEYGDAFVEVINFQINRQTRNLSIWYYTVPNNISGSQLLPIQLLLFVAITGFLLSIKNSIQEEDQLLVFTTIYTALFCAITRQYYNSYAYFFFLPLLPILTRLIRYREVIGIMIILTSFTIFSSSLVLCDNRCYPPKLAMTWYSYLGVVMIFLSTIATIIFSMLYLKQKFGTADRNSEKSRKKF